MSDSDEDKTIDKFEGIKLTNSLIDAFSLFSKHVCKMWPTGPAVLSLAQRKLQAQPIAVSRRAEISNFNIFEVKSYPSCYLKILKDTRDLKICKRFAQIDVHL